MKNRTMMIVLLLIVTADLGTFAYRFYSDKPKPELRSSSISGLKKEKIQLIMGLLASVPKDLSNEARGRMYRIILSAFFTNDVVEILMNAPREVASKK